MTATMALAAANGIAHVDLPALLYGASPAAGGIAAAAGEALHVTTPDSLCQLRVERDAHARVASLSANVAEAGEPHVGR